jgi:predicted amidophosphoribosyltransferase
VRGTVEDLARGALDLLWPRSCHGCGATLGGTRERWLCRPCRSGLALFAEGDPLCARCAAPLGPGTAPDGCEDCRRLRPRFEAVRAAGRYRDTLRRLIVGMKYARLRDRAWPLGELIADRLRGWGPIAEVAVVVPFPTTRAARRRRGFDPPALLAAEVASRLRLPIAEGALARSGDPPPQASLARGDRLRAPRGTVRVARPDAVRGRTVLLVDDVLTTGATADAAARALLDAGAARVLVAVAARA